jgi:sigma-E factor negative regulatory protein RseB
MRCRSSTSTTAGEQAVSRARTGTTTTTILLIGAVGLLLLSTAGAATAGVPGDAGRTDDQRAVALLSRAATAIERTSFHGSRIVTMWGPDGVTTVQVQVTHVAGQGTLAHMRDGGLAEDAVAFLAPGEGERSRHHLGFDSLGLLIVSYDIALGPVDEVAGRPAVVVEIGKGEAIVARIWVDSATGLPLRREVYDEVGRPAMSGTFVSLTVDDEAFIAHLPPGAPASETEQIELAQHRDLEDEGWACPGRIGPLRLVDLERVASSAALHISYSDGLSRVSVFEQRGVLADDAIESFRHAEMGGTRVLLHEGMPRYVVWESGGTVYTVVSDAPLDTIGTVVAAFPKPAELGFWERIGGGMARLGVWVTPFV